MSSYKSKASSSKRRQNDSDSNSPDTSEDERRKDLQERDEFSDRLKKKDQERTRNIAQASGISKSYFNYLLMNISILKRFEFTLYHF